MDDDAQDQFVADLGIPPAGVDVRLVATVMDLYPNNRKLAGAALRTFSAMAKMTRTLDSRNSRLYRVFL